MGRTPERRESGENVMANGRAVYPAIEVTQHGRKFLLASLPVSLLAHVAYASVRGKDKEEGAVQRVLNSRRISGIKSFTIAGGDYPTCIVLNWVNKEHPIERVNGGVIIPDVESSAQLIDGQHRVAGLRAAMEEKKEIGDLTIPVAIYESLSTKECAVIFLSINTEQKPTPRSLVFDLYGVAEEHVVDAAASRARDIVIALNEEEDSPYFEQIKFPGSPRRKGGIALSTAVTAIKPLVESKGDFEQRGISELEIQKSIIKNLFSAIRGRYGDHWDDAANAFLYASGFVGAIDFLRTKLLSYGHSHRNFTQKLFYNVIRINADDLILQQEVKGKGGKDAPGLILDRLNSFFHPEGDVGVGFEV
jgi:DGQHR domain-containing protein